MSEVLDSFRQIWLVDFEFYCPPGEKPTPICMVASEFRSGRIVRLWGDDLVNLTSPPWSGGPDVLVVAYFATAELGCFLALGWEIPTCILDLYIEFRNATNGLTTMCGNSLLGALTSFGIDGIEAADKEQSRRPGNQAVPAMPSAGGPDGRRHSPENGDITGSGRLVREDLLQCPGSAGKSRLDRQARDGRCQAAQPLKCRVAAENARIPRWTDRPGFPADGLSWPTSAPISRRSHYSSGRIRSVRHLSTGGPLCRSVRGQQIQHHVPARAGESDPGEQEGRRYMLRTRAFSPRRSGDS